MDAASETSVIITTMSLDNWTPLSFCSHTWSYCGVSGAILRIIVFLVSFQLYSILAIEADNKKGWMPHQGHGTLVSHHYKNVSHDKWTFVVILCDYIRVGLTCTCHSIFLGASHNRIYFYHWKAQRRHMLLINPFSERLLNDNPLYLPK